MADNRVAHLKEYLNTELIPYYVSQGMSKTKARHTALAYLKDAHPDVYQKVVPVKKQKGDSALDILDVPQKKLMKQIFGQEKKPSELMTGEEIGSKLLGQENYGLLADLVIDPLNTIPLSKAKYFKNFIGLDKIPLNKLQKAGNAIWGLDKVDDAGDIYEVKGPSGYMRPDYTPHITPKFNSGGKIRKLQDGSDPTSKVINLPDVPVTAKGKAKRKYGLDKIDAPLDELSKMYSLLGFTDKQYDPISNSWEEPSEDWKKVQEMGSVLSLPIGMQGLAVDKATKAARPLLERLKNLKKRLPKAVDELGSKFKSEIDWAKWNKEIPENTQLMEEYSTIEQQAKANGSWMKNPDGSKFQGTPEQFIQQNSRNFKDAFGDNTNFIYHNSPNTFEEFLTPSSPGYVKGPYTTTGSEGIYFSPNKDIIRRYLGDRASTGKSYTVYHSGKLKNTNSSIETLHPYQREMIENEGFSGIQNVGSPEQEIAIFDPKKIKSAIGNNGMFDITNPNIYKGLVPAAIGTGAAGAFQSDKAVPKSQMGGPSGLTIPHFANRELEPDYNASILQLADALEGGGYNWNASDSGSPYDIEHNSAKVLAKQAEGTYCSGYTCGVSLKAMQDSGLLKDLDEKQLTDFKKIWYGAKDYKKGDKESLSTAALRKYGLGYEVPHEKAKPGDIAQIWRKNGSGHSVIFKDWVYDDDKNVVGIKYRSTQKATKGIGDRTEMFGDKIDPSQVYLARIGKPKRPPLVQGGSTKKRK